MLPARPSSTVHWHLLPITAPTCTPTDLNPFISPPLFHYAGRNLLSKHFTLVPWGQIVSQQPLSGALGNPDIPARRGHLLHLPHGSHTTVTSGKLGPDPSPNVGNIMCPNASSHPKWRFSPSFWLFHLRSIMRNQPLGFGYAGTPLNHCVTIPM